MTEHVLLVSIGPVQDFIASARKCRDLWFGSWLLSELAKAAAAGIVDAMEGAAAPAPIERLIFPAPSSREELLPASGMSVANKIVARVSGDADQVKRVAERGRARLNERLSSLRDGIFARVGRGDSARGRHFYERNAIDQINELIDYVWIAVEEGDGDYGVARKDAERLLGARKSTKTWAQPSWADGMPKSSLDGVRESVLDERIYPQPVSGPSRPASLQPDERQRWYRVDEAERLCGVGLLKRWGAPLDERGKGTGEKFMSSCHLAALPFMIGVDLDAKSRPAILASWQSLQAAAKDAVDDLDVIPGNGTGMFGKIDGAILFPERLKQTMVECGHVGDQANAERTLRDFLRCAARGEPGTYFAVLVADGDGMGAIIDSQAGFDAHRRLSTALDGFAQKARCIVDEHRGRLIYSGGDDVLALLPLHSAVECADALARDFRDRLAPWAAPSGRSASLSAGIGVVHYLEPMGAALDVARKAEKRAKLFENKNALAIIVSKRGGADVEVRGSWSTLVPRLRALSELHRLDAIPGKAGHELTELGRLTINVKGDELAAIRTIQASEAKRILGRKRARKGRESLTKDTLDALMAHLSPDPAELGRELWVAELLAGAQKKAAPAEEEE
jgi:CRISPR-associated protein Cmr2